MPVKLKVQEGVRTDAEIAREINRNLKADLEVPDDRITVRVSDGLVSMEGAVNRDSQKDAAERCAAGVAGVRQIANRVYVDAD